MKTKDLLTIATTAVGTAALTVATLWTGSTVAGSEGDTPAQIARPKLVSHGVELTLAPGSGQAFKGGAAPVFELTARNTADQTEQVSVCVSMSATSLETAMSRLPRLAAPLWQQEQPFTLKAREIKTVTLSTKTNLPANSLISVSLREGGVMQSVQSAGGLATSPRSPGSLLQPAVLAMSFSTFAPAAGATPALARR